MATTLESLGFVKTTSNRFVLDGVQICTPQSIKCEDHVPSRAWTDGTAVLHDVPVRYLRKVTWHYDYISYESMSQIRNLVKSQYINNHSSRHVITTDYCGDVVTMNVTVNSPMEFECETGVRLLYKDFNITFTETDGIYLL